MNFLAHTHLSPNNDDVIFGNFIADFKEFYGELEIYSQQRLHEIISNISDISK